MNMYRKVRIKAGAIQVTAELNSTRTAQAIWNILPLKSRVNRWGDELYFSIPISLESENAQELVSIGDLGYWPPGTAFCIFFGTTPTSQGQEIRPASPVNVFGKVISNTKVLGQVASGTEITVERETEG